MQSTSEAIISFLEVVLVLQGFPSGGLTALYTLPATQVEFTVQSVGG